MILTKQFFYNIIKYTVTYNANGGSGSMTDSNSPYIAGSTVTVLNNSFTKSNSIFVEWNTKADGSGISYNPADTFTITEDTVLYAQWVSYSRAAFGGADNDLDSGITFKTLTASTSNGIPGHSTNISQSTFDQDSFSDAAVQNGTLWYASNGTYNLNIVFNVPDSNAYKIIIQEIIGYVDPNTGNVGYRIDLGGDKREFTMNGMPAIGGGYIVNSSASDPNPFEGLTRDYAVFCVEA